MLNRRVRDNAPYLLHAFSARRRSAFGLPEVAGANEENFGDGTRGSAPPGEVRSNDGDRIQRRGNAVGEEHDGAAVVFAGRSVVQPVVQLGAGGERGQQQHEQRRTGREEAADAARKRGLEGRGKHEGGGRSRLCLSRQVPRKLRTGTRLVRRGDHDTKVKEPPVAGALFDVSDEFLPRREGGEHARFGTEAMR